MAINSCNNSWYSPMAAIADGYKVINSKDGLLYVVPFAGYYHSQGLDGSYSFNSWAPNIFGGTNNLTAQHPNLLGAMPAVWNDQTWATYTELQVRGLIEKTHRTRGHPDQHAAACDHNPPSPAAKVVAGTPGRSERGLYGQRWIFEQEVTPDDRRDRVGGGRGGSAAVRVGAGRSG
ncbi:hypothetical protein [Streptomyces sp. NBC_00347]|uniref:hypothetical protein n=1 Tax=Streptomyces sp. NBC_00347 TaxID=2975721 RepID=UPI00224E7FD5|nr:hypothetical protein [Streptomyces sp. NBC_00347]MCX5126801.1 hypothetical protein [Streptomyces sp. NBC_00347]